MLGALRRNKNSPIITGILGLTAIVMIGFGISYQGGPAGLYAADVNGDLITDAEYAAMYANAYRYRQSQDPKYNKDTAKKDRLRENVLYSLITTKILAQRAEDRGLAVDDAMLRDEILEDERFQENGRFSKDLYERWMNSLGTTPGRFEQAERERILSAIYLAAVQNMRVSEEELRDRFFRESTKINVSFIQVPKKSFVSEVGTVTAADQDEWMKQEGAEDKILKYYQRFKSTRYDVPKKVCAQHILVKTTKDMPPDLKREAQETIKKAAKAVKDGMDFADAAAKFSEDANKQKGGDLGCFSAGQMLPQVETAAFGLKPGEVSGVVETPFGYHVVKVTEIKEPVRKKLEDVKDEIVMELVREDKASQIAKKKAEAAQKLAKEKASLSEVVEAMNAEGSEPLKVEETGPFPEGREFLPRLGNAPDVAAAAWRLTEEKPVGDAPIETDNAWVIIRLVEKKEPTEEEFEQARLGLSYGLTINKQNSVYEGWTEKLRKSEDVQIHPVALSYDDQARQAARSGQ